MYRTNVCDPPAFHPSTNAFEYIHSSIYLYIYLPIYSTWERGRLVEASIEDEWIDREAVSE